MANEECLFWFRRDLRLEDNHGLFKAAKSGRRVRPLFIFDTDILDRLPRADARVEFILAAVEKLHHDLRELGGGLTVEVGRPTEVFARLCEQHKISEVIANQDYEPYAITRDHALKKQLDQRGIKFSLFKDHVIFAPDEIVKDDGTPYRVYGAYARRWRERFAAAPPRAHSSRARLTTVRVAPGGGPPSLKRLGFQSTVVPFPGVRPSKKIIAAYADTRDLMGVAGTSRMGVHLRFGTISPRKLARLSVDASVFFGELIWREFFAQVLAHNPRTVRESYDLRFERVPWRRNKVDFKKWCEGRTGYPVVDAGMRELNQTGFMHNRARMITASFLCKHLLIDWRWGERYFTLKLLDYDQSSNVGNWQWVAGCGCDPAPYFRVFNPSLQAKRFDPTGLYAGRWVPEISAGAYVDPIVPHEFARRRALGTFSAAIKGVQK